MAVTGSTGFIGGAVVRAARERGYEVFAYGRRNAELLWDLAHGPVANPPEVDVVVHCAAAVTDWGPPGPIRAATVGGTTAVAASFGGARLVHISSASVYNPFIPTLLALEGAAPVSRYLNDYQRAKADAERVLIGRPNTVILRPHAVYGAGDTTLLPRILAAVRGSALYIVGNGQVLQSLTSIENLVAAIFLAAEADISGVFNIADAEPVELNQALRSLLAERSLPVRLRHLPFHPSWLVAGILESVYRRAGRRNPPRLTRYAISHLAVERTLDITKAQDILGFNPLPTDFRGAANW